MNVEIRNHAGVKNNNIRFIKWKLHKLYRKFSNLLYAETYISKEGNSAPFEYKIVQKVGLPGNDIILSNKSKNLKEVIKKSIKDTQRYLRKNRKKELTRRASGSK